MTAKTFPNEVKRIEAELARLLTRVRSRDCDVAVGSRFVHGDGYEPYRYKPSPARVVGTGLLRRAMRVALGRPFHDATSGMYAVSLRDAGLRVEEIPVDMRERASGESKLAGKKAALLVLTVIGTLVAYRRVRKH